MLTSPGALRAAVVSFLSIVLGSPFVQAQEDAQNADSLEQRVRVLEAAGKAKANAVVAAGERGFSLRSADGDFDLKLRLLAQFDGRFVPDPEPAFNDGFGIRRAGLPMPTRPRAVRSRSAPVSTGTSRRTRSSRSTTWQRDSKAARRRARIAPTNGRY